MSWLFLVGAFSLAQPDSRILQSPPFVGVRRTPEQVATDVLLQNADYFALGAKQIRSFDSQFKWSPMVIWCILPIGMLVSRSSKSALRS